jgi:hypothetical protein
MQQLQEEKNMTKERWTTFNEVMDWYEGKSKTLNIYVTKKKKRGQ